MSLFRRITGWLIPLLTAAACSGIMHRPLPERAEAFDRCVAGRGLRVGAAERDITPSGVQYLGGFDLNRTSRGVASPLKVRAMVVELGGERLALVGVDNLGLMLQDSDWVKTAIPGFANGSVFIASSHTHAAPDLIGLWGFYLFSSGRDPRYLAMVRRATAEAVLEARRRAAPARFVLGEARLPQEGLVRNANRRYVFDRRLTVLKARALDDDRPLGTLLHMACHPEVMPRGNRQVSADFVGDLCDAWKERGHGQAVFFNGALGAMVTPDVQPRDMEGVRAMGSALADLAEAALLTAESLPVRELEIRRRAVYLPLTTSGLAMARTMGAIPRELYDGRVRSSVGYLRLGSLEAVAVPGEIEPGLAERIRRAAGRPELLFFGLVDDELGYLMSLKDALDPEFAYERSMSPCSDAGERIGEALLGPSTSLTGRAAATR